MNGAETTPAHDCREILIVDDIPDNIRMLNAILRTHYKLRAAPSGERALALVRRGRPPDLILLDIMMPGMDGYEVCRRLKADPATANIPVIFVTAKSEERDEQEGFAIGAVDYIMKPFRPAILLARVHTHLKLRALQLELERLAVTDELSGCFNRRYFMQQGEKELDRHDRYRRPLALLMLDIDHFKRINDDCGHAVGDRAIQQLAKTIRAQLRDSDLFARIGGEEFVVLLPETEIEAARNTAERLRRELHFNLPACMHAVTVSIGVAAPGEQDSDLDHLLSRADEALYRAKEQGRDQVVVANR